MLGRMRETRRTMALLAATIGAPACGPDAPSGDDGAGTSGSLDESTASSAADTTAAAATTAAADESTTGAALDCEAHTAGCPAGCMKVTVHPATWDDPHVGPGRDLCIAEGPPLADGYRSSWFAEIDGELLFVTAGQICATSNPVNEAPSQWQECTASADEPAACRHLCAQDVCPGELDLAVLQGCTADSPCPPASLSTCDGPGVQCLLAALRDRVPGRYEFSFDYPNQLTDWLLVIDDDGAAQATFAEQYSIVCANGIWQPARTCGLGDPQLFADCLALEKGCADTCFPDQFSLAGWLVDCVDMAASCP
jgi:hypothetical protein